MLSSSRSLAISTRVTRILLGSLALLPLAKASAPAAGHLAFFDRIQASPTSGAGLHPSLILAADGWLYGHAEGPSADGAVWRMKPDGTGFAVLRNFTNATDGSSPAGPPILGPDGKLYGSNLEKYPSFSGTVWRMNPDGTEFGVLQVLGEDSHGSMPSAPVFGPDGLLYGSAVAGGHYDGGTLWRMCASGTEFTKLKEFGEVDADGYFPRRPVIGSDGKLHGVNHDGLWRMNLDGTGFVLLKPFADVGLAQRYAADPILGPDGKLYDTSATGVTNGPGDMVWRINVDGTGFTALHLLPNAAAHTAYAPQFGPDGMLYGTSAEGGTAGGGILWRMNPDGTHFTVLYNFDPSTGPSQPLGSPAVDANGNVFGTTIKGGADHVGVIFEWSNHVPVGTFTIPRGPIAVGEAFTFDASDSSDPDGDALVYEWDFGDGSAGAVETTPTLTHAFASAGRFAVTLRVTDSYGAAGDPVIGYVTVQSGASVVNNGSFESGLSGWTMSGNVSATQSSRYTASDGTHLLAFNAGDSTPNGVVTQTIATTAGQTYVLEFDVGVLAYNKQPQRLQLTVSGNHPLASQRVTLFGAGGGSTTWAAQRCTFVADRATTEIRFQDVSSATISLDLLLDHVRVAAVPGIANGSFEQGSAGWTLTGNVKISAPAAYLPTDGRYLASFNSGDTAPNGQITQTFSTVPGQQYRLSFDVGVVAYNRSWQRLEVSVKTNTTLVAENLPISGAGGGSAKWIPEGFTFTADSTTSIVSFRDISSATASLDLLLDHVRLE